MISSLFLEQVEIIFNQDDLQRQLESQRLKELIKIDFELEPRYDRDAMPSALGISIENKSRNKWIYLEWDYSCIIDLEGQAKRLVRVPPGSTFDLLPLQMFTVLSPDTKFEETLTSEAALERDAEKDFLKIGSPLLDLSKLNKDKKKKYVSVEKLLQEPAKFFVRLGLRLGDKEQDNRKTHFYILNCMFLIKAVHWKQQLPWNLPKKND